MSDREREISEVVAAVTHDLQNALQAISHQAELLAGEDQSAPVAARTELILKSVDASSAMVRRLSGLARV
ncbi:MAG: hypothetical protein KKI08_13640, partial [Armatimonadetes bacterium]|nr:hypothetical protein [Armatimonadota bacterium]